MTTKTVKLLLKFISTNKENIYKKIDKEIDKENIVESLLEMVIEQGIIIY